MHLYAFGSLCRGEVDIFSDIDILALTDGFNSNLDSNKYSIYSYKRIKELWDLGNPFAWHLFLESRLIYSCNNQDFLKELGLPLKYNHGLTDCIKFHEIFLAAKSSFEKDLLSIEFDFSSIFLSIRNFATCYSLAKGKPNFSRDSALYIDNKLIIDNEAYQTLKQSRILCTRGIGDSKAKDNLEIVKQNLIMIDTWMNKLLNELRGNC